MKGEGGVLQIEVDLKTLACGQSRGSCFICNGAEPPTSFTAQKHICKFPAGSL